MSVLKFGAVADARRVGETYVGTDNAAAFNKCAAYCRKNGLTMLVPMGNYGVASTIWLTNPEVDGLRQRSITVVGSNRGAYRDQSTSANICVLKDFQPGVLRKVKKWENKTSTEPIVVPVLGISNGRQVHIQGIGIQGNNIEDYICGIALGNVSHTTSIENCSLENLYAGLVFPGIRKSTTDSVIEGNCDLLVVEQCTFNNAYNIVCAGTQPHSCHYRNNSFHCTNSVFTGNLITSFYEYTKGSHTFTCNLFGSTKEAIGKETVYFDLSLNHVTIDGCQFEAGHERQIPEVLVKMFPQGGKRYQFERFAFTNNVVNFAYVKNNPSKYYPLIDSLVGNRMIFQGNSFNVASAVRIKAYGALFIGNSFRLHGPTDLKVTREKQTLLGEAGNVKLGKYDFNHFIARNSGVLIQLPNNEVFKENVHYKIVADQNAFEITKQGKALLDKFRMTDLYVSYVANDAMDIRFKAWGGNELNPPHGWESTELTLIGNKIVGNLNEKTRFEKELTLTRRP